MPLPTTTFDRAMGVEVHPDPDEPGVWRASFEVADVHRQPYGIVHGGMYAALAETVASMGTAMAVLEDGFLAMGQSNSTTFLRPTSDGVVEAVARPIHQGRTTWVWEVDMTAGGRRVARSTITMAVRPRS